MTPKYRNSLVGTVICSGQLLGNNTLSYRTMSPIRPPYCATCDQQASGHTHSSHPVLKTYSVLPSMFCRECGRFPTWALGT